jgi:hypothetical protein
MPAHLSAPSIRDRRRGRTVASYFDARGAVLAVTTLRRRGFSPDAIAVQPGMMSLEGRVLERPDRAPDWMAPALVGSAVFTLLLVLGRHTVGAVSMAVGLALGAAGLARLAVRVRRRRADTRLDRASGRVVAKRFDVVVTERDQEAEHVLASWWDPEALPAPPASRSNG